MSWLRWFKQKKNREIPRKTLQDETRAEYLVNWMKIPK